MIRMLHLADVDQYTYLLGFLSEIVTVFVELGRYIQGLLAIVRKRRTFHDRKDQLCEVILFRHMLRMNQN